MPFSCGTTRISNCHFNSCFKQTEKNAIVLFFFNIKTCFMSTWYIFLNCNIVVLMNGNVSVLTFVILHLQYTQYLHCVFTWKHSRVQRQKKLLPVLDSLLQYCHSCQCCHDNHEGGRWMYLIFSLEFKSAIYRHGCSQHETSDTSHHTGSASFYCCRLYLYHIFCTYSCTMLKICNATNVAQTWVRILSAIVW